MQVQALITWFMELTKALAYNNERRLILLSGSESWAYSLLAGIEKINLSLITGQQSSANDDSVAQCLIYGDSTVFAANVNYQRYRDILGSEADFIIFADSKFNVDALAALAGSLKAGGLYFLVMPELNKQCKQSLFIRRFYDLVNNSSCHGVIHECNDTLPSLLRQNVEALENQTLKQQQIYPMSCKTAEQFEAVEAVIKVVTGHRNRPLVLTADRGRGKSSALAIASAKLLSERKNSPFKIIVTAPVVEALSVFFKQLASMLPEAVIQGNSLVFGKASLFFCPIDQLLVKRDTTNLVIVDEAAGVPVYLLEQLLGYYHRVVFSSTVHGYEGAGRGFSINFKKILKRLYPQAVSMHIHQPIRWRKGDPLEAIVFESCLLKTELPTIVLPTSLEKPKQAINNPLSTDLKFNRYTAKELVNNERLLADIFAVLITAHYQTKPSDLQLMLDNSQIEIACLTLSGGVNNQLNSQLNSKLGNQQDNQVIAVALVMHEGKGFGVNDDDINAIKNAKRRLRNHFLPQSLLNHCGDQQAFNFHYLRIMRIAVRPEIQQQGIGLRLMSELKIMAREQSIDFIGASFGVNHLLLKFWLKADYSLVRIGFSKDKASGEHSALVVHGLTDVAKYKEASLKKEFYRCFYYLLLDEYQLLNSKLVRLILADNNALGLDKLSMLDVNNVVAYTKNERQYSNCVYSIYLWFKRELLKSHTDQSMQESLVLVARLLQKQKAPVVCKTYGLSGKKMLDQHIKNYITSRFTLD
jgi:tRNA(Met) cytidine acetyltransferase